MSTQEIQQGAVQLAKILGHNQFLKPHEWAPATRRTYDAISIVLKKYTPEDHR